MLSQYGLPVRRISALASPLYVEKPLVNALSELYYFFRVVVVLGLVMSHVQTHALIARTVISHSSRKIQRSSMFKGTLHSSSFKCPGLAYDSHDIYYQSQDWRRGLSSFVPLHHVSN